MWRSAATTTRSWAIAETYGAVPLRRRAELAQDAVTLDPVIFDAVQQMEERTGSPYDIVVTLQPTSPVLHPETLQAAIAAFVEAGRGNLYQRGQ